jgi:hypothetical protein
VSIADDPEMARIYGEVIGLVAHLPLGKQCAILLGALLGQITMSRQDDAMELAERIGTDFPKRIAMMRQIRQPH